MISSLHSILREVSQIQGLVSYCMDVLAIQCLFVDYSVLNMLDTIYVQDGQELE